MVITLALRERGKEHGSPIPRIGQMSGSVQDTRPRRFGPRCGEPSEYYAVNAFYNDSVEDLGLTFMGTKVARDEFTIVAQLTAHDLVVHLHGNVRHSNSCQTIATEHATPRDGRQGRYQTGATNQQT